MKQLIAFLAALALLMTCACGRAENAETTEPATDPVTTAAPTTAAPVTKAPEPETVISYDFQLEELPDIGRYQPKTVRYFYDGPLDDFKPSGRYGAVIPYRMNYNTSPMGWLSRLGFMTADGSVITGPVYDSIELRTVGDASFYFAERKLLTASLEHDDGYYDKYSRYVIGNSVAQVITVDGGTCVSFQGEKPSLFRDKNSGITLIHTGGLSGEGRMRSDTCRIYDTDFNLLADFTDWIEDYPDGIEVIGADETGYALRTRTKKGEYETASIVLLTEGTELTKKIRIPDSWPEPEYLFGGWVVTADNLYDFDGNPVLKKGSSVVYLPDAGCCAAAEPETGSLIRFSRNGSRKTVEIPQAENISLRRQSCKGREYLLLEYGDGYRDSGTWQFTVYDDDLRAVFTTPYSDDVEYNFPWEYQTLENSFAVIRHGGKTEIRDLTGTVVAEVPFEASYFNFDNGGIYLKDGENSFIFYSETGLLKKIPFEVDERIEYFDEKNIAFWYSASEDSNSMIRIADLATGEILFDRINDYQFTSLTVNGKTYFSFLRNNRACLCDGNMRLIAEIPDDIFA